jgi:probable rRNA maturation factor
MEIAVKNCQRSIKINPGSIKRVVESAIRHLSSGKRIRGRNLASGVSFDPAKAVVSVLLVGDRRMREMNRTYRGLDRTTDVLSFSQLEGSLLQHESAELGDIVISPAQAKQQAHERGTTFNQELALLLVHGLLHLIGYDHEKNRYEAKKMREKESELIHAIQKVGR